MGGSDDEAITPGAAWRPDLVERMRFDPLDGIVELERHLARLKASAQVLGLAADRHAIRNELHAATFRLIAPARVILRVAPDGASAIETGPLPVAPPTPVTVALAPLPVAVDDQRRVHSTGDRAALAPRDAGGAWETLFLHPDGQCVEGSATTLFVPDGDRLRTPPRAAGVRPGILREQLLDEGRAIEARLLPADLASGFLVGNMLVGLVPAILA